MKKLGSYFMIIMLLLLVGCNSSNQGALPTEQPPVDTQQQTLRVKNYQSTLPITPAPGIAPAPTVPPAQAQGGIQYNQRGEVQPVTQTLEEQQMLNMINRERQTRGLNPFAANAELTRLARLKAQDMIQANYFGHDSPTYGSPFDMMTNAGVTYTMAAENIAGNFSLEGAHTSLMNSPGHRANLLNPELNQVGIGIVPGGPYGHMFVQMFIRK